MPISAWLMLIFGCVILYGGFFWSLRIALKGKKEKE
ncbi:MAG: MetS family NSS transporter small subunit [Calditrichaeota bacterium]|nr:MetS family NSS transporter small subunit [Calditrichota bacterium]